jgi:ribonucleoside-diphosphate reductase alpha chain
MLDTTYQEFIHLSRYSRWQEELGRRENWGETVCRYLDFFADHLKEKHDYEIDSYLYIAAYDRIEQLDVLPSMRCIMAAGPALQRDHIAGYNCAYLPIDKNEAFDEAMYILMCSTGVGFSVESQYTEHLPVVPERLEAGNVTVTVQDSKEGWAKAYRELLGLLYQGIIPQFNTSMVRPAGSRLKTMGGRASGPAPLIKLYDFTVNTFLTAKGRKLTSLECHDIICNIGDCVVVGGVRRSALISLSDLDDEGMRLAKSGEWWNLAPHRMISNNSVVYNERPTKEDYDAEWQALYESKSGERGIFNRQAATIQAMSSQRRDGNYLFGTNPCSEINLRPEQFCNLSTIVARHDDDESDLLNKAKMAATFGTWQSTLTDFRYINDNWRKNCEEERLLGVSITGIMGNPILNGSKGKKYRAEFLEALKRKVMHQNQIEADNIGIRESAASTCVKPEGTTSQLTLTPSGIHTAYSPYYIRRVRQDIKDPVTHLMIDQGVPHEKDKFNRSNEVFSFALKTPEGTLTRNDLSAVDQLEHWKDYHDHWCEHKPSMTVYVREQEWDTVSDWVWDNFDSMSGVAFLPYDDHTYEQAPYEEITEQEYKAFGQPYVDWELLEEYENEDGTTAHRDLACAAGVCEI